MSIRSFKPFDFIHWRQIQHTISPHQEIKPNNVKFSHAMYTFIRKFIKLQAVNPSAAYLSIPVRGQSRASGQYVHLEKLS